MNLSSAATDTAATIDPTVLAVLSIFGGVTITVIAGFVGAWIQGRREHTKWVREQRYEAFVRITTLATAMRAAFLEGEQADARGVSDEEIEAVLARVQPVRDSSPAALAPVSVLGPASVHNAALDVLDAWNSDEDTWKTRYATMRNAIRKTLGVQP